MKKQYMIYRVNYDKNADEYSTWVYVGKDEFPDWKEFGMEMSQKCVRAYVDGKPTDEAECIHYSFINRIKQAMDLKYDIQFTYHTF